MRKTIITVAGRTAAGKSLIAKKLAERLGLRVLKSYTTRAPRPDEIADPEHADHIFVSEKEFDELKDIAAETKINGIRYCTTMEVLNKSDFYVIDPDGIDYLKKHHGMDFHIVQFYIYADENIREKRFLERGRTAADFQQRCSSENEQFDKYEDSHGYDIIIFNNGDIDYAINVMESYVKPIMEYELEAKKNNAKAETIETTTNTEKVEENQDIHNIGTKDLDPNTIVAHDKEVNNQAPKEEVPATFDTDDLNFYIPDELIDNDSVNLRSPSCALCSGNEEHRSELSLKSGNESSFAGELSPSSQDMPNDDEVEAQSVDGVSDSPYTSSNLRTGGQPDCSGADCLQQSFPDGKPGRGLQSNDDDTPKEESNPNIPSDGASANEKTSASTMDTSCKSDKKTEEVNNETASTESLNANSNMNKELDANCDKSYEGEDEDESMEAILLD